MLKVLTIFCKLLIFFKFRYSLKSQILKISYFKKSHQLTLILYINFSIFDKVINLILNKVAFIFLMARIHNQNDLINYLM